jgi:sterol-4alpha-carboxylate 3-dehydrogenase (decarboxylating)
VLEANRTSDNFVTCALRPAAIFGEHDTAVLLRTLRITGAATRFQIGPNDNLFDYTYVGNVAHAHLLAVEALVQTLALDVAPLDSERVDGEAFLITNGSPVYFWDFIRRVWLARGTPEDLAFDVSKVFVLGTTFALAIATIMEFIMGLFGKTPNMTRLAVRNSAMTRYYNIDKARMRLKYEPITNLEEGIIRGVRSLTEDAEKTKDKKDN